MEAAINEFEMCSFRLLSKRNLMKLDIHKYIILGKHKHYIYVM